MRFAAVKKWKDGGASVEKWFETEVACLRWIQRQPKPQYDEFEWCVGEY